MEYVTLNNGVEMPLVGYGTYRTPNRDAARLVTEALAAGYRHVDTAQCYGNEGGVGDALAASGIGRDDLFVTTKTWTSGYTDTKRSIDASLKALRTDHIDLLLIHEPSGDVPGIWRALEEAYQAGKARSIGVSNFLGRDFDELLRIASITPTVNQLECHVYRQQREMQRICEDASVLMTSWSPLAAGKNGFFGERNSNGFVPRIGHWSFIVVCAELADMRLHIEDVKVKRREIAEALWEADKRVESGLVLINEQNYPDILNAQQVLKLKKDFSL
jgi:diketogulonate reductase-like aldo/keto reductase